jgi:hypothetical protein
MTDQTFLHTGVRYQVSQVVLTPRLGPGIREEVVDSHLQQSRYDRRTLTISLCNSCYLVLTWQQLCPSTDFTQPGALSKIPVQTDFFPQI